VDTMAVDVSQEPAISLAHSHHMQLQAFTKKFTRVYDQYYISRDVDETLLLEISNTLIPMDLFNKIKYLGEKIPRPNCPRRRQSQVARNPAPSTR
jgi:hypothetical protein